MATFAADMSSMENVLVQGLSSRDENAFQELFHRFGQRIFRTAMKILKEEESAKDALQETMINIHRAAGSFRGEARLATWINKITVNVCLEMIRKNKKHTCRTSEDVSDHLTLEDASTPNPFIATHKREVRRRVWAALGRLNPKQQVVVRMHDLEGYTIREIAEQMDVPEGTIKSRLFYGREELKRQLTC